MAIERMSITKEESLLQNDIKVIIQYQWLIVLVCGAKGQTELGKDRTLPAKNEKGFPFSLLIFINFSYSSKMNSPTVKIFPLKPIIETNNNLILRTPDSNKISCLVNFL